MEPAFIFFLPIMRAKSFSAEKRQKQDQQATIALGTLLAVTALGWAWSRVAPYCWGALQGAWSPLLIIMLRYAFRAISGKRMDVWGVVDALAFIVAFVLISIRLYPHDVWHASIMLLCLVSSTMGIQKFRFTPLFMFVNCLIAGAILL